jgi:uracil-DNA glycosylase family 4
MELVEQLNSEIIECRLCPRLVEWRERIAREKKAAHRHEEYWGRPVPILGDPNATRMIVGLAPAAHGANRTGQMFTGDRSGDWLFRALHKAGVANHANSSSRDDGMRLSGALIAASAHCAPPANKPTPEEIRNCSRYLTSLLQSRHWVAILCLGSVAWNHVHRLLGSKLVPFSHRAVSQISGTRLVASYHPSQQNTFTGKLTEQMLDQAIADWLAGDFVNE